MPTYLDVSSWSRREHFNLFRTYDRPFFNICANVDVGRLKALVDNTEGISFFVSCLYLSTRVANEVEPFRYRIRGDSVLVHDVVHPGTTIPLRDDTFGFAYLEYRRDFRRFADEASREMDVCASRPSLNPRDDRDDLIHFTALPWISFTSVAHARRFQAEDSTPKIVFGKYERTGDRLMMPVSIEVHHALMDGVHVARYFSLLEKYLVRVESILFEGPD